MKTLRIILLCAVAVSCFSTAASFAAEKPVNLSLFTPISIAKETDSVTAFRFNLLYGKNTSVQVVDLGLVNHTTSGLSKGVALGTVNINQGSFKGLQWGFVNHSMDGDGLQLGVVNFAQKYHGLQIGLINIIKQDGFLPVFPFVNWSF